MQTVRVGLLGCGTVGRGVVRLLQRHGESLRERLGVRIEVARVAVRDATKAREVELPPSVLTTDGLAVVRDPNVHLVVELMGGLSPARQWVLEALDRGVSVVTANKMLLAHFGAEVIARAVSRGADVAFEGAVGGGIPVVRVLRESLAGDRVIGLSGILNGTCNFILTRMRQEGATFEAALREAQALGYAEAEPSLDVDGHDAAHKLVVLSMIAFGAEVDVTRVPVVGIGAIEPVDHRFADRFGFVIKQIARARRVGAGLELTVRPALVRKETPLASVGGVLNAVAVEGEALGTCHLSGRGAGELPTAVSVVGDIVSLVAADQAGARGALTRALRLSKGELVGVEASEGRHYVRIRVFDRPGVLARITGALGAEAISIEQFVQEGGGDATGAPVDVVLLTHRCGHVAMQKALGAIASGADVASPPCAFPIEDAG